MKKLFRCFVAYFSVVTQGNVTKDIRFQRDGPVNEETIRTQSRVPYFRIEMTICKRLDCAWLLEAEKGDRHEFW